MSPGTYRRRTAYERSESILEDLQPLDFVRDSEVSPNHKLRYLRETRSEKREAIISSAALLCRLREAPYSIIGKTR